jgi:pyruvate dehydrogenase E2 component (dihydrolipoamide acetyltransferase)
MPSLGADMEYGTLTRWRVAPGAAVARGDVIAEVETQKGNVEVEVFDAGVVEELLVAPGTRVPVGAAMARIRSGNGAPRAAVTAPAAAPVAAPAPPPPAERPTAPLTPPPARPAAAARPHPAVRASPAARRLAVQRGIELTSVTGTGPEGAVTLTDVERAAAAPAGPAPGGPASAGAPHRVSPAARRAAEALGIDVEALAGTGARGVVTRADVARAAASRADHAPPTPPTTPTAPTAPATRAAAMRQAIAAAMARANREIPHYYLAADVDVSRALRWLDAENQRRPVAGRVLPAALLLKAVALGLREVPELNGFWVDDTFRPGPGVHLGVAVSLRGGGLAAPAIHEADTLPLDALMRALRDLVQRARTGMLRSSELTDPTVTVTNLGDLGVRSVFGVIYPPQVALVGLGRISERPWAEQGLLGVRPVVTVTLAADHRASDGHRGGRLLTAIDRLLQTPEQL